MDVKSFKNNTEPLPHVQCSPLRRLTTLCLLRQHLRMSSESAQYLVVFAGSHISAEVHQARGIHKNHFKCLVEVIQDRLEEQTQSLVP